MAKSKVIKENFIALQGWMITDLHLKGNELIIYACIYGFSQVENQTFNGSLQYLADWTNSSKQTVINCLKSLVSKGLIVKTDSVINGVKFCEYHSTNLSAVLKNFEYPSQKSSTGGSQKSLPNNIDYINNIKNIIIYLNAKLGSKYSYKSKKTQDLIKARFNEIDGLTAEDFFSVIDKKYDEWHEDPKMEKYLRPETLFGTKFEGYLNAKVSKKASPDSKEMDDLDDIF